MKGERMKFDDLPLVAGEDEARRVHRTPGLYLVNGRRRGVPGARVRMVPVVQLTREDGSRRRYL
jgi:hypothetical protein